MEVVYDWTLNASVWFLCTVSIRRKGGWVEKGGVGYQGWVREGD